MALKDVTCPSGLRIAVRGMKIKEANALADTANVRRGNSMETLLAACVTDIVSVGHYPALAAGEKFSWSKALLGDRFAALMGIRISTYGPEYAFGTKCDERACGESFEWVVDLEKDLAWKPYDEMALQSFFANKSFPFEMPDGNPAELRFLVGDDEKEFGKARRDKQLSSALAARIVTVTGIHPNDRIRYIEDMELDDATAILAKLDEYDGGIETEIAVQCPKCGNEMEINLPFDRGFWMPKKAKSLVPTP